MKNVIVGFVVWSSLLYAQGTGEHTKALTRCDVLVYASLAGEGHQFLINGFRNPGIAFDVTEPFAKDFKSAGASDELVTELRKAVRSHSQPQFACNESIYAHVAAAARLTSANKLDEAQKEWAAALGLQPDNPMLHVGLSMSIGPHTSWRVAEIEAQKAIELDPGLAVGHSRMAAALTMLAYQAGANRDRLNLAREQFQQAVRLAPENCFLRANFAVTLISLRDYAAADEQVATAEKQCPKLTFPMYVRANSLAEQGKRKEAIAHLRSALQIQPNNCIIAAYMISLLREDGDSAGALTASHKIAQVCSGPASE